MLGKLLFSSFLTRNEGTTNDSRKRFGCYQQDHSKGFLLMLSIFKENERLTKMFKWHDYVVYKIYDLKTTNLKFEFRHFLFRMFQCYFLRGKKIFSGKILTKTLEKNPSMMYESLIILVG